MDEKFNRRFVSFTKSLDALAEARERDLSDSFVLSGTSAKFSITSSIPIWAVPRSRSRRQRQWPRLRAGIARSSTASRE